MAAELNRAAANLGRIGSKERNTHVRFYQSNRERLAPKRLEAGISMQLADRAEKRKPEIHGHPQPTKTNEDQNVTFETRKESCFLVGPTEILLSLSGGT